MIDHSSSSNNKFYKLTNDIDMLDHYWVPIGDNTTAFKGTFDGNGHTISNIIMNSSVDRKYAGLFGNINSSATIKSLIVNCLVIYGDSYSAALVGQSGGKVENCNIVNAIVFAAMDRNSTTTGAYYAHTGGMVGCLNNLGQITGSSFTGNVAVKDGAQDIQWVGGFVGQISSGATITNCSAKGTLTGSTAGTVSNNRGGFIGIINSPSGASPVNITNCTSEVTVGMYVQDRKGRQLGGFIGYISGVGIRSVGNFNITNCSAKGNVNGVSDLGGFIGDIQGSAGNNLNIVGCSSEGGVTSLHPSGNANAGGFIGSVGSTVTISKSYSNSHICIFVSDGDSSNQKSGGFIGIIDAQIKVENCYATGDVGGSGTVVCSQLGGFVGAFTNTTSFASTINNCYATGFIGGNGNGFIGYTVNNYNFANFSNNYFCTETTGKTCSGHLLTPTSQICGKTIDQMNNTVTYVGWDFTNIWELDSNHGCPFLRS
jgi:hypothetical protein